MACQLIPNLRGPTDGWCRRVSWSAICVDKAKTERTSKIFECLKRAASILCSCTLLLCSFPQNLEQNTYVPFFHDNFFLKFFVGFFCYWYSVANILLWLTLLEWQRTLQPWRRKDWVWLRRDQVTNLLENTILQDLSWNEDRPSNQLHCRKQAWQFFALADRWREIPQHLIGF